MTTFNTGNPLGSTDVYDRYDNTENLDNFSNGPLDAYPDRFGVSRQSLQGIRNASQYQILGAYAAGLQFTSMNQVFSYLGEFYAPGPSITLPYTTTGVGAGEVANFRSVGDAILRSDLAVNLSFRSDFSSDAAFNADKPGKFSRDSTGRARNPTYIAGDAELAGATLRDAYVVGRTITGATDCHAFADRTIMDSVTDAGTYGAFDATTELRGSHAQNHLYSFQHRANYSGAGVLTSFSGVYTAPKHSGSGSITNCDHVVVNDVNITSGGTVASQIGVRVNNLSGAAVNVGVNIAQSSGYALYAGGGAPSYLKGYLGLGRTPTNSVALEYQGAAAPGVVGFSTTTSTAVQAGAFGDFPYRCVTNGGVRLEIAPSANAYAIRAGADDTQPLGDATRRWKSAHVSTVYLTPVAVASLPSPTIGAKAFVTNATATTFASVVAGGGANAVPVYGDGANWRIG